MNGGKVKRNKVGVQRKVKSGEHKKLERLKGLKVIETHSET